MAHIAVPRARSEHVIKEKASKCLQASYHGLRNSAHVVSQFFGYFALRHLVAVLFTAPWLPCTCNGACGLPLSDYEWKSMWYAVEGCHGSSRQIHNLPHLLIARHVVTLIGPGMGTTNKTLNVQVFPTSAPCHYKRTKVRTQGRAAAVLC